MGADLDFLQRTVILIFAMIPALLHGARDRLIRLAVVLHFFSLLYLGFDFSFPERSRNMSASAVFF